MNSYSDCFSEPLEQRVLLSWAAYASLVSQDKAATDFPKINGTGETIAIIDTGIDYTQPELGGGFGKKFKVIGGYDFVDNDSDPMDESGHGTSVAGVIAASPYTVNGITYQGVAPDAKLVALRVGTETDITDANIDRALKWIIQNYRTYGITVVNLSLGSGSYTSAQTNADMSADFQTLHDDGLFVVAASGNSNDQQLTPVGQEGIAYPAADPNVFAVGAVDSNDVITDWSQRGRELDLLAPGVQIVMPQMGGGFTTEDGTSFASPYVAGTAALIKEETPTAKVGDIGSILMSSGTSNRDGDTETGNTSGLLFSRLNIDAALNLAPLRIGRSRTPALGTSFDTALDAEGVLYASYYDAAHHRLLYETRDTSGLWSKASIVDATADVGAQSSIAVDASGKVGIAYYDSTNTALKFAEFNGTTWATTTIDSRNLVGTSPSLKFDVYGNGYLAYYKKSGGDLRLARLNRDANTWTTTTVDGTDGADDGAIASLDVGEAAVASNGIFTQYDTTVAIAYSDRTNGDLKYARLDVIDPTATWYIAVVDNTTGVGSIDLHLHAGPTSDQLQAQIAYHDLTNNTVKYAYRNTTWFTETVVTGAGLGGVTQLSFDANNNPQVSYTSNAKKAVYTATRQSSTSWTGAFDGTSSTIMSVTQNDRTGDSVLTWLDRSKTTATSISLV